jgi:Fe2+ or Zn2+ uptake regulation protein
MERSTNQKKCISQEIEKMTSFFTAEELYERLKNKKISLATIYRFLKKMRDSKHIYSYTCNGKLVYSTVNKSHCHFICEETGEVIHFDVDSLDFLKNKIPGNISSFQIEVRGKCKYCLKD